MSAPTPLRRELLIAFGILFTAAFLGTGLAIGLILPLLDSFGQTFLFVLVLVVGHLLLLFFLGGAFLRSRLVQPLEEVAADARRIADGDYRHRIRPADSLELESMRASVNAMADRLIQDQRLLAENVASLDRTNRELVQARDQVVQTARLASVGTLAAGIAHEVGNPLGAIMVYVDIGRRRSCIDGGGEDPDLFDAIRNEARRIDRIVRGLLDYARPRDEDAGPVAPEAILARVRDLLEGQGKLDRVDHRWELAPSVPAVHVEPHRLEQVLVNLVLNALDALQDHAEPVLHVAVSEEEGEAEELPPRRQGDPPGVNYMHRRRLARGEGATDILFTARRVVVIQVSDNGPGIPEAERDAVFDLFYTTKEPGKGTGLGLSICARLVEGMGGRIEAGASELGGARFTVRLPGHPEEAA
jgi:hypothetical protein